jgi:Bcr/CflA subfamily drug resistance transporter
VYLPAIWLVVLIVGLPQLSETVYTPSLPDISQTLRTSESMAEYTLTIYLFGFAIGSLFWGKLSDSLGRKPCIIAGILVFIVGCLGCYFSNSIEMLMISRCIQAFGGSIGSVLGQAICRDVFHGPELGKAYSAIGSALSLFPALGPLCGGIIAQQFGWRNIFIFLIVFAAILTFFVTTKLPETHPLASRKQVSMWGTAKQLIMDKKVLGFGLIVAACNGISFSYFAEGSFYLIKGLGLSPSHYGLSFMAIALAALLGGLFSKKLHNGHSSKKIMGYGLGIVAFATTIFSSIAATHHFILAFSAPAFITMTIISQMMVAFGICMVVSNGLALALMDYKHAIGTASSLFGFFNYFVISIFTFLMGFLHDGTLLPMPLYFLAISCFMLMVHRVLLKN